MQMFDCLVGAVDSNGATLTHVRKRGVPAPEVILLQSIHGPDRVTDLQRVKDQNLSEEEIRENLVRVYGKKKVEEEFGPSYRDLPRKVKLPSDDITDEDDDVDNAARARKARGKQSKVDPAEIMA